MRKRFLLLCLFVIFCSSLHRISAQIILTKAGTGNPGDFNSALNAPLNYAKGIAVDGNGNVYIADQSNHRIRKVDAGTGIISTIVGNGNGTYAGDGAKAIFASLWFPSGIALDANNNIYIADAANQRIRKVDASTGIITTIAGNGSSGFSGDGGQATAASLNDPTAVTIDAIGNLYIADRFNQRIRKLAVATGIISTIAGNGSAGFSGDNGLGTLASLNNPYGIAADASGNIFIADANNNRIRKISATSGIISTIAGNGTAASSGDGNIASSASLYYPRGISIDGGGNIYIADQNNNRIRKITISTGIISTVAGKGLQGFSGDIGQATAAWLNNPSGVTVDANGNLYILDYNNYRIRKVTISNGVIRTIAGNGSTVFFGDGGQATSALLNNPADVSLDNAGNLYIADATHNRIRKVDFVTGNISTVAGRGDASYCGDGGQATSACLNNPLGITIDATGDIYIADTYNNRIRKINASTGVITTVAGNGSSGYSGDGGQATSASLFFSNFIAVDANGDIYIADNNNHRVRKVTAATGIISTIAGNGTPAFTGDGGQATSASLNNPRGIAIHSNGDLYISDANNNCIRKVDAATGIITTVAGNGIATFAGDGGQAVSASLNSPYGLAVDAASNIYIADILNYRIRKITAATGIISTIAGNGTLTFFTEGGLATNASLNYPSSVRVDPSGNVFIADALNGRIRYICATPSLVSANKFDMRTVYPEQNVTFFESNCNIQAKVQPSGSNPVSGKIYDSVWIEPSVPVYDGQPYVQRHYGFTPSQNSSTATATLTLYYTQAEFTAYNAAPNHGLNLPIDATDAANNKANVRVVKRSGTSNNGTGLFNTYSGNTSGITPTTVVWDTYLNAWAVTFDVAGFSGFFLTSIGTTLPLTLMNFDAKLVRGDGILSWKTESEENTLRFDVERSSNSIDYAKTGSLAAVGHSFSYSFADRNVVSLNAPVIYYRLKIIDRNGDFTYSKVVAINIAQTETEALLYPNPVNEIATLRITATGTEEIVYNIMDVTGKKIFEKSINLVKGINAIPIDTKTLSPGSYILTLIGSKTTKELKFIKP